jgi:hypothetical protein
MKKCNCDKYFVNKYNMHDQNCESLNTDKGVIITVGKVSNVSVLTCCKNIFENICNEKNQSGVSLSIKEVGSMHGFTIYEYPQSEKNKEIALYNIKEAYEKYINK